MKLVHVIVAALIAIFGMVMLHVGFLLGLHVDDGQTLLDFSYWGTTIGGITGIVSVVLLYHTYQSQKKELRDTHRALELQKIDSAFYNMLSLLHEIVNHMEFSYKYDKMEYLEVPLSHIERKDGEIIYLKGREYLNYVLKSITGNLSIHKDNIIYDLNRKEWFIQQVLAATDGTFEETEVINTIPHLKASIRQELHDAYSAAYAQHHYNLGHYFRTVYNIMKFILKNTRTPADRQQYLNFLQSQLSNTELALLFYNCISDYAVNKDGKDLFRQWLDKYGMLENLDADSLGEHWHHRFYPLTDFKFLTVEERAERKTLRQKYFSG